jgi:hypothetical protein
MNASAAETNEFEADFALGGEVEFEETEDADTGFELELLAVRVRAARYAGA